MSKRILLGVIIADCHVNFQSEMLRGVISQAYRSNCDAAVIAPLHNFSISSVHKNTESRLFDLILSDKIDGIIYARNTFQSEKIRSYIDKLCKRSGKPVMLMDSDEHKNFETTSVDDCEAFEIITDHLIEVHGKRKIYCLTGPKKMFSAEERLSGYLRSMKNHGIKVPKEWYEYGDFWHDAASDMARRIVTGRLERPEAVVCGNDISAVSLCRHLIAGGIRIPEDIAVTGYDASVEGMNASPSVTSYSRPNFQLGAEAVRRLYRIITGKICSKVRNEYGELRPAESCGCGKVHTEKGKKTRLAVINSRYENYLLYGDMLFDISNTANIPQFAERLDNFTFFIHKLRRFRLCLTDEFIRSTASSANAVSERLCFGTESRMTAILAKTPEREETDYPFSFAASEILPDFSAERSYPSAFIISPLHYNDNFFGYLAISFGKEPISFSSLYMQWVNYVDVALEQMRIRSILTHTVLSADKALMHDEITGLPNRNGTENAFTRRLEEKSTVAAGCIIIEIHGIKKAYYQDGEEKSNRIISEFAKILRKCIGDNDILGLWSPQMFCVISFGGVRADELFRNICRMLRDKSADGSFSCDTDFTVGEFFQSIDDAGELSGCIYQASINRLYTHSVSENSSNPQFDKLCQLRGRIRKNPEYSWNIGQIAESLYISKSYLQKIYKTYFNKSIIEEMIEFRLDKARELLSNTDRTVTEIARECGYSSYNYFVRQFRNAEGISPSEYREKKENDTNES